MSNISPIRLLLLLLHRWRSDREALEVICGARKGSAERKRHMPEKRCIVIAEVAKYFFIGSSGAS